MVKFRGFRELFGCWNKAIACLSPAMVSKYTIAIIRDVH